MRTAQATPEPEPGEEHPAPRLSLAKEPAIGEHDQDHEHDEHQDHDEEQAPAEPGVGALAEVGALVGREALAEAVRETCALAADIACHYAHIPARAAGAIKRVTVRLLVRLKDGSKILPRMILEWIREPEPAPKKAQKGKGKKGKGKDDDESSLPRPVRRGLGAVVVVAVLWYQAQDTPVAVIVVAAGAWCAGALLAAHRGPAPDDPEQTGEAGKETEGEETITQNDHEKSAGEQHTETDPAEERRRKATALWQRTEHALAIEMHKPRREREGRGIRAAVLLAQFHERGELRDFDEDRFIQLLKDVKIPVRAQMYFKIDGAKDNRKGVHVDDFEAALGHAPRLPADHVPDLTPTHPTT